MKIAIEIQPCLKNKSGIGVYTYELTKRLQYFNEFKCNGYIFNFMKRNHIEDDLQGLNLNKYVCTLFPYGIYRRIWKYIPIRYNYLFKKKIDIYQFFNFIVPKNIDGKVITTIHDLTYILYPETMEEKNRKRLEKDMESTVKRADYILTISESSKNDIIKYLRIPENKISVVYPGVEEKYTHMVENKVIDKVKSKYNIEGRYILYLGTLEPRKNIETIIKSYNSFIKNDEENIYLVLAGKKGWLYESIYKLIDELGIEDKVVFTDYVDDDDKPALYQGAEVFLFPSLYEGFGIPVVEAMASGTPVITSNSSSLPEVAGDAAIITDPLDYQKISDSIKKILEDSQLKQQMIEKGIKQVEKFNWDKSAEKLKNIYINLYNGSL